MSDNPSMQSNDTIPEMLGTILSNKELMEKISAIVGSAPKAEGADNPSSSPASLLSDPDIMAKLPEVISVLRPMMESKENGEKKGPPPHHANDRRTALLCALKPYLSPKRREAIDYITKISKLGDVMKNLKL